MTVACGLHHAGVPSRARLLSPTDLLAAKFSGVERHIRRLAKVAEIEITGGVASGAAATPPEGSGL